MNSLRTNLDDPILRKTQRHSNQCKPTCTSTVVFLSFSSISQFSIASDEDLFPVVLYYWCLGLSDEKIIEHTPDHFNGATFGFRWSSCSLYLQQFVLNHFDLANVPWSSIERNGAFLVLDSKSILSTWSHLLWRRWRIGFWPWVYGNWWWCCVKTTVWKYLSMSVFFWPCALTYSSLSFRKMVLAYLNLTESEAINFRKWKCFHWKRFWSAGVMDIWLCDQHDKWKQFGLCLHLGFDPYPSKLQWLKVWWSNCDPQLIGSYYLEAAQKKEVWDSQLCFRNMVTSS